MTLNEVPFHVVMSIIAKAGLFFVRFEGNSILPENLKLDFFPLKLVFLHKTRFSGHFKQILQDEIRFLQKKNWFEAKILLWYPFLSQFY